MWKSFGLVANEKNEQCYICCFAVYYLVWNAYDKTKDTLGTVFYSNGSIKWVHTNTKVHCRKS